MVDKREDKDDAELGNWYACVDGSTSFWARQSGFEEQVIISIFVLLVHFLLSRSSRSIGMEEVA